MKICIVGGIFDKSNEYRAKHRFTPETILFEGLSSKGFDVTAIGHRSFRPSDKFDIVHIHHLGKAVIRIALTQTRSRFVFTGHNGNMLCGTEKSFKNRLAFKYVLNRADMLVGLSEIECQYLRQFSGKNVQVKKISNGIPSDFFQPFPREIARTGQSYRILFVGQLIPNKGVDDLFHAVNTIAQRIPWELILVYQNSSQENHFLEMAQKLGITEHVNFLGFLSALELASMYRNVDVLVLPSYAESLPSVITESLLSGTPVVATNVGGIPEQIVSPFGELVPPGDWNELGAALTRVYENLTSYRELAQEIHDFAASRFSIEQMVNEHIQLYEAVLTQTQSRRFKSTGQ